jgi:uncharacterized membrane protein YebE (DUF533 family)
MNTRKVALWGAGIVGLGLLVYGAYWLYNKSRTKSGNPQKDNRDIKIVRA